MAKQILCSEKEIKEVEKRPEAARKFCQALEKGDILFFPNIPFSFPQEDIAFLLAQKQTANTGRKNIAYKPHRDTITNLISADLTKEDKETFLKIMRNYSYNVEGFLGNFLSPYRAGWKLDYASFRPVQEKGRNLRKRARNDLLHVDAFPSRPVHGARILRFFTNINPEDPRKWITADTFSELMDRFKEEPFCQALKERTPTKKRISRTFKTLLWKLGIPLTLRSTYDEFMLQLHHFLKEEENYQKNCPKQYWDFPPNSCWAVFTDGLTHAALEGKYALEQTFLISNKALLEPKSAPVSILESFSHQTLIHQGFANLR